MKKARTFPALLLVVSRARCAAAAAACGPFPQERVLLNYTFTPDNKFANILIHPGPLLMCRASGLE